MVCSLHPCIDICYNLIDVKNEAISSVCFVYGTV
jgi:hypothetical protein